MRVDPLSAAWGDDEALAALVHTHYARVRRFGGRVCRDADEADDAVQQAFIKLSRRPELLQHRGALSWLLTTVRRACIRLLRSLQRWESLHDADAVAAHVDDGEQALENRELMGAIQAAISALDSDQRAVLVLRDLEGLSGEQTAEIVGVPLATMKTRLHRARRAVRDELIRRGVVH
jgi:RNA polymerase sigma-70 factor, ECF subfamily